MFKIFATVLTLLVPMAVLAESSVVLGRVESVESIDIGPFDCPTAGTCSGGYRLRLRGAHPVVGVETSDPLVAVLSLHLRTGQPRKGDQMLLVLEPIADMRLRNEIGASFYALDASVGRDRFCLLKGPLTWGIEVAEGSLADDGAHRPNCFALASKTKRRT